jgi:hypothetical protein
MHVSNVADARLCRQLRVCNSKKDVGRGGRCYTVSDLCEGEDDSAIAHG